MVKKVAIVLLAIGGFFIVAGGYQLFKTNHAQKDSLQQARTLLAEQKDETLGSPLSSNHVDNFNPGHGETVGILNIPRLEADLPIVEGTDEDELEKGVGHYNGTAYPQQNDQVVLSGHRDTVFRRMGELELGDTLSVQLPYGDFSYEIVDTKVVDTDDRSVINPTNQKGSKEVLTVTTCYPFSYVGNAPDRYIITALPVEDN
ncbi:class D sortase [Lentibacillus salicampi]|uniref:Class D sortase n=1 Tax=Lentibacillus salicampi TaxID=175306 RepID=A0A4Y9AER0_9BACI|nr:class D sortase [Lentibacillus salicampi]TFJ94316.1 class D sortase [Lentibacillus salicampi]